MTDEFFAKFEGAFAERTLRAYRSDFDRFCTWCDERAHDPFALGDAEFVRYVEQMSETLASATIRRHVASISTVLRLSEHHDATRSPRVELALKRMHRRKGRAQKQAIPLTSNVLERLLRVCDTSTHGLRDQLLLRLGYETMRRRSELCAFRFEDLEVLPDGRAALRLGFSKTDQYGLGKLIPISSDLAATIEEWGAPLERRGYLRAWQAAS